MDSSEHQRLSGKNGDEKPKTESQKIWDMDKQLFSQIARELNPPDYGAEPTVSQSRLSTDPERSHGLRAEGVPEYDYA